VEPDDDRRTKRLPGNVCRWTSLYVTGYNASMQNDAIPDAAPIQGSAAVSGNHLLDRLIDFFNRLPAVVRGEASLVIAALSGDEFIDVNGEFDFQCVVRGLFEAPTRLGCLGNLINDQGCAECRTDARPRCVDRIADAATAS
jgi:hypothetical protein